MCMQAHVHARSRYRYALAQHSFHIRFMHLPCAHGMHRWAEPHWIPLAGCNAITLLDRSIEHVLQLWRSAGALCTRCMRIYMCACACRHVYEHLLQLWRWSARTTYACPHIRAMPTLDVHAADAHAHAHAHAHAQMHRRTCTGADVDALGHTAGVEFWTQRRAQDASGALQLHCAPLHTHLTHPLGEAVMHMPHAPWHTHPCASMCVHVRPCAQAHAHAHHMRMHITCACTHLQGIVTSSWRRRQVISSAL